MPPDLAEPLIDAQWIRSVRPPKPARDPFAAPLTEVEDERQSDGSVVPVGTLFLVNRECPFTCLMCDLWQYTMDDTVPVEAIATQMASGLSALGDVQHLKLYNAGNFFDDRAVPPEARRHMAEVCAGRHTLVVENHPKLVDKRTFAFYRTLDVSRFEVAMGLETSDAELLGYLNKQMTPQDFERAAGALVNAGIGVRTFVLVRPPFCSEQEGVDTACASLDFAFGAGAECCAVIPTRAGNGAMDVLASRGDFAPPTLRSVEQVVEYGIQLNRGRVFADLWDIERIATCPQCASARVDRLRRMNLTQSVEPSVDCACST